MGLLDGLGLAIVVGDRVVAALERERALAEESLEHGDRLGQPLDARGDRLEWKSDRVVLGAVPAGPDADLQSPATEHVEAGHVLGQDRRVAQVVVDHERPDPQGLRGGRDDRQGR